MGASSAINGSDSGDLTDEGRGAAFAVIVARFLSPRAAWLLDLIGHSRISRLKKSGPCCASAASPSA